MRGFACSWQWPAVRRGGGGVEGTYVALLRSCAPSPKNTGLPHLSCAEPGKYCGQEFSLSRSHYRFIAICVALCLGPESDCIVSLEEMTVTVPRTLLRRNLVVLSRYCRIVPLSPYVPATASLYVFTGLIMMQRTTMLLGTRQTRVRVSTTFESGGACSCTRRDESRVHEHLPSLMYRDTSKLLC